MGQTLGEMIDALPKERRERVDARYRKFIVIPAKDWKGQQTGAVE